MISWSLRDQIIIPSPGRLHISKGGHRLEIPRLRTEDAGDYHCSAQNEVGAVSGMVTVEILGEFQLSDLFALLSDLGSPGFSFLAIPAFQFIISQSD